MTGTWPKVITYILDKIGHSPIFSDISNSKGLNTHMWLQICPLKIYELI